MAGSFSTVRDFVSVIKKNNIARSNRYRILFSLPEAVFTALSGRGDASLSDKQNQMSLTCLAANIPGIQMQTSNVQYGNIAARKVTHGRVTSEFSTTFIVDGKYTEQKVFDEWVSIVCRDDHGAVEFYDNYVGSVIVECLDSQDRVQYKFMLSEAYPISVSSLRLDRTSQNQVMTLDVTWSYHIVYLMDDESKSTNDVNSRPQSGLVPGAGDAKKRLLPIPGLDSFSSAVQSTMATVSEFRGQLQGVLDMAKDVREQVRDAKMSVLDGVRTLNGVVKDVKAITNISNDVKREVVSVVTDTRNQLGSLKSDVKNISNYPKR